MIPGQRIGYLNFSLGISWLLILLLIQLSSAYSLKSPLLQRKSSFAIKKFLLQHSIIPEGIAEAPRYLVEVRYTRDCFINLGNKVDPATVQRRPRFIFYPSANDTYYTLVLLDLDVPTRSNPIYRDRQHWLLVNIPGHNWTLGETLTEYLGPIAPRDSGLHRYLFIVYQQPAKLDFNEKKILATDRQFREGHVRSGFNIEKFAEKYNFGSPYAANFFLTGWPLDQE